MATETKLGTMGSLQLSARSSALIGSLFLWAFVFGLGMWVIRLPWGASLMGGLLVVALHWASILIHHLGHAIAARRTGYPMTGVQLWGLLGRSLYPATEPALPGRVHIRRALGGPLASTLLGLAAAMPTLLLRPAAGLIWWLALFVTLDNLVILGPGAFLPLGFTDGGTILHWWGRR